MAKFTTEQLDTMEQGRGLTTEELDAMENAVSPRYGSGLSPDFLDLPDFILSDELRKKTENSLYYSTQYGIPPEMAFDMESELKKARENLDRLSDIEKAIKETPENIKIGTIGLASSTMFAIKRRGMMLAGGGIFPDEMVKHQFEPIKPEPREKLADWRERKRGYIPGMIRPTTKDWPMGTLAEAFGLVTRLPHVAGTILQEKQRKLAEAQAQRDMDDIKKSPITETIRKVTQSGTPSMSVALGVSLLTGDPIVALALLGEMEGGGAFQTQLEGGVSIMKANVIGELSEAAEIGGEMLVLPKVFKGLKEGFSFRQALSTVLENTIQEGITGFNQRFLEVYGLETTKGLDAEQAAIKALNEGIKAIPGNAWVGGASSGGAVVLRGGFDIAVAVKEAVSKIGAEVVSKPIAVEKPTPKKEEVDLTKSLTPEGKVRYEAIKGAKKVKTGEEVAPEEEYKTRLDEESLKTIESIEKAEKEGDLTKQQAEEYKKRFKEIAATRTPAGVPVETPVTPVEARTAAEPTTEPLAPAAAKGEFKSRYQKWYEDLGKKLEKEAIGEDILDEMISEEVNAKEFNEHFWDNVYPELPPEQQHRFERYVQKETGFKPGDAIALDPKTKEETIAENWADIGKMVVESEDAEHLQGTERGLVVLETIANNWLQQKPTEKAAPKTLAPAAKAPSAVSEKITPVIEPETQVKKGEVAGEAPETKAAALRREVENEIAANKEARKIEEAEPSKKSERKVSRAAQRVQEEAIEKDLTENLGDLPTYETMSMKKQAKLAAKEIENDYEKAKQMAYGKIAPPSGLRPASIYRAVAMVAEKEGDVETLRNLAVVSPQVSLELTVMGQAIKAADVGITHADPVKAMQDLQKTRENAVKKKRKIKSVKAEKARMAKEMKSIIRETTTRRQNWAEFVESIRC